MEEKMKYLFSKSVEVPDVAELGKLYQRAIAKDHQKTALAAEAVALKFSISQGALAEARTMAAFLDAV